MVNNTSGADVLISFATNLTSFTKQLKDIRKQTVRTVRAMGTAMTRMAPQMKKAFSISDAVADSLSRQGWGKETWTKMTDLVSRTTATLEKGKKPILSISDALDKSLPAMKSVNAEIKALGTNTKMGATTGLPLLTKALAKTGKQLESMKPTISIKSAPNITAAIEKSFPTKPVAEGAITMKRAVVGATKDIETQLKKTEKRFAGWALSIMFLGQAMKRTFNTIWKSSSKTFTDVMSSVSGTTTQFQLLEGSMTYMKFVAGQALEPIAAAIIPIIDKVSEWIQENESLFAGLVVAFGVGGTALGAIGQAKLGFDGITQAVGAAKKVVNKLISADYSKIIDPLKKISTKLTDEIVASWKWLIANPLKGGLVLGILAGIIATVMWIWKLQKAMGGWGEFFKNLARGILRVIMIVIEGIIWVGEKVFSIFMFLINLLIKGWNKLAEKTGGSKVAELQSDYEWGDGVLQNYIKWETEKFAPKNGYMDFGGMTPQQPQTIIVELDGEQVSTSVSTRQQSQFEKYAQGN